MEGQTKRKPYFTQQGSGSKADFYLKGFFTEKYFFSAEAVKIQW